MNNLIGIWDSFYPQLFALLVNTAWQVTLLATLILLSIFLLKIKSAATRYALWLTVVFSPLFLPLLNLAAPAVNIHLFQHQPEQSVYEERAILNKYPTAIPETAYYLSGKTTGFSDDKPDTIQESSSISKEQPSVSAYESRFVLPISSKEILLLLWMLGVFGMTARFAKGLHGLRSLRKEAVYVEDESIINLLDELRNSFSIQRKIQLAISGQLTYPVSFGWRKPIILMPSNFTDTMFFDEVRMTFIHELAHFKRRDYLTSIAISFLRIPLFFHPLFIFATKQLQIQQEHICDDWVIQFSKNRTAPKEFENSIGVRRTYAQCLLRQAEVAILKKAPIFGASVVSGFKNMRRRIDMILNKKRNLSINLSKKAAVFVLLICCVFTAIAATTRLLPLALAQQTEEEKLIAQIEETLQWYPMGEKLSQEQRTAAYRKNSQKGLALCQQFLEKYPQHEDAVKVKLDQLSFLTRLRRYDEAEQLAREFLAKHPTDSYTDGFRWTLVSNYKSKGEYDAALTELELIKEPEWVVHWERNQIYQQKEMVQRLKPLLEKYKLDADLRKKEIQQILENIKPPETFRIKEPIQWDYKSIPNLEYSKAEVQQLYSLLEKSKLDAERRKEEIQRILKTIELDKETNLEWMRYWRGVAYGEVGEYQKAIADISNAIAAHGHPAFYFSRGVVYARLGEEEKATADLCAFIDRMLLNEKPGLMIRVLAYAGVISGDSQQKFAQLNEIFKALTGQDIGYDAKAVDAKEWKKAFDAWRTWWQANRESFRPATSAVTLSPGGFGF